MRRRGRRSERGTETLEWVIVTPALLLTVLLVVAFGLQAYAQHVAEAAAHQAASAASLQAGTAAQGRDEGNRVLHQMASTLLASSDVVVTRGATEVRAVVTASVVPMIPLVSLGVRAVDSQPVEMFRAAP